MTSSWVVQHNEAWRKWWTVCTQHFHMHVLEGIALPFYWNFVEFDQWIRVIIIGYGNSLVPNKPQPINRTNDDSVHSHVCVSTCLSGLVNFHTMPKLAIIFASNLLNIAHCTHRQSKVGPTSGRQCRHYSWATLVSWRLKLPTTGEFVPHLIQATSVTFPSQRANN